MSSRWSRPCAHSTMQCSAIDDGLEPRCTLDVVHCEVFMHWAYLHTLIWTSLEMNGESPEMCNVHGDQDALSRYSKPLVSADLAPRPCRS